jgi:undecaprenyl-diphosphatase
VPPAGPMLDLIDRHVRGLRAAIALYLALSLVAGVLAVGALMAVLAMLGAVMDGAVVRADDALLHAIVERRPEAWQEFALDVTALGNTLTLVVLVVWAAAAFWTSGRRLSAVVLAVSFVTGRILTEALKAVFARPRPEILEWGTHVASAAFPSAHAMSATIVYGALAYLLSRGRRTSARVAAWTGAAVLVTAIAASRVYLGVHYVSDAVGGILAGAVWAAIVLSTLPAARRFASARPDAARLRME